MKNKSPLFRLEIFALVAWLSMLSWVGFDLYETRRRDLADSERQLEMIGRMLGGQIAAIAQKMDSQISGLAAYLHEIKPSMYADALRQSVRLFPELERFRLSDARGRSLASSDQYTTLDISGRDYFQTLRDNPQAGLVISAPLITLSTGNCGVMFGRRVENEKRRFTGAVTAVMRCQFFDEVFSSMRLPRESEVFLLSRDLTAVATWPPRPNEAPLASFVAAFGASMAHEESGWFTRDSPRDGVKRIYYYRYPADQNLPFVLVVGLPWRQALTEWQQRATFYLISGVIITSLLLGIHHILNQRYHAREIQFARELAARIRDARATLDLIPDPAWMTDAEGYLIAANARFLQFKGVAPIPPGSRFAGVFNDEEQHQLALLRDLVRQKGGTVKCTLWLKNHSGEELPFEIQRAPMFDESNRINRFVSIAHGLSEQLALKSGQRLIDKLFEHDNECLSILNRNQKLITVNSSLAALLGYDPQDLPGKRPEDLIVLDSEGEAFLTALRDGSGKVWNGRLQLATRTGEPRRVTCRLVPLSDDTQQWHSWLVFMAPIPVTVEAETGTIIPRQEDALTGLPNRAACLQALAERRAAGTCSALAVLNIDHLNYVNNAYGRHSGDELLKLIASRLRRALHSEDLVCRLSGDLFGILLADADAHEAERAVSKLMHVVSQPLPIAGLSVICTACVGICMTRESPDADLLLQNATTAMYNARHAGPNHFRFFAPEMNAHLVQRITMEYGLQQALENGELQLYYQPQVDIGSGRIAGCEALLRWQHPQKGMVSPAEFIPLAEETGLILPIGRWVLEEACRQNKAWQDAGLPPIVMAVNLSPLQFESDRLLGDVDCALKNSGLNPRWLELEMTESTLMHEQAITQLANLKERGIRLSIDDFGTGYSSLSYLQHFPVDKLKIDQSFVRDLGKNAEANAIVRMVLNMSRELNLKVIAEGVENEAQLNYLSRWHCPEYQGYLCSRPVTAECFVDLLRALGANTEETS